MGDVEEILPLLAAALDSGACKPTDYFVCAGKISVAGTRFRCANGHIHGSDASMVFEGIRNGITYKLVSCDTQGFTPQLVK